MRKFLMLSLFAAATSPATAQSASIARGEYLVNRAILCGDCHSPREGDGRPIQGKELTGAPVRSIPVHPNPNFGAYAPSLRGLPAGYGKADLVKLLMTGLRPDGAHPHPPMPPFRLNQADAEAITAYLASLKP